MSDDLMAFQEQIRRVWFQGNWWFSVVDAVGVLADSATPRNYWAKMKQRLAQEEGFVEVLTKCQQLKMCSTDGKMRTTDAADTETLLRIVQSLPSPRAEPFKRWLAQVGAERLQENAEPSIALERLFRIYRKKGYSEKWISQRVDAIRNRTGVTAQWGLRGATPGRDYALLTDTLSKGTFDITTAQHKDIKGLTGRQNLQDSMTVMEMALTSLADATAITLHEARNTQGFDALQNDCTEAE